MLKLNFDNTTNRFVNFFVLFGCSKEKELPIKEFYKLEKYDWVYSLTNINDKLAENLSTKPRIKALFAKAKVDREKTNQDRKNVIQELNNKFNSDTTK